jgi:hypothetical protein
VTVRYECEWVNISHFGLKLFLSKVWEWPRIWITKNSYLNPDHKKVTNSHGYWLIISWFDGMIFFGKCQGAVPNLILVKKIFLCYKFNI